MEVFVTHNITKAKEEKKGKPLKVKLISAPQTVNQKLLE